MNLIERVLEYREHNRLSYRLVLAVVLCSVVVTLLAASVQLYFGYRRDIEHLDATLDLPQRRIFSTKPVGVGTGLDLSVSYFIITEHHGGDMTVESRSGMGTVFIITLPMKRMRHEK